MPDCVLGHGAPPHSRPAADRRRRRRRHEEVRRRVLQARPHQRQKEPGTRFHTRNNSYVIHRGLFLLIMILLSSNVTQIIFWHWLNIRIIH